MTKETVTPVVILAGGLGTRLGEITDTVPKPMVEIGGRPIVWHIMKHFYAQGFNEFVILTGYKSSVIKDFFLNYHSYNTNIQLDFKNKTVKHLNNLDEKWHVTILDTGLSNSTGSRLRQASTYLKEYPSFFLTYGDGLIQANFGEYETLLTNSKIDAIVTAVNSPGRYGKLELESKLDRVIDFDEKPAGDWINGGYFLLRAEVLDLLPSGDFQFEKDFLPEYVKSHYVYGMKHSGFWKSIDTPTDLKFVNQIWDSGEVPWKNW